MSTTLRVPTARSRFTVADDILLLQEVAPTNPFEDHDRSDTEEQYSEKEHLLQEINNMAREFGHHVRVQPRKMGTTPGNATGPGSKKKQCFSQGRTVRCQYKEGDGCDCSQRSSRCCQERS
ncbi:hypothetical protein HPB47_000605 [Ixodes persulcatus]|uniref:Uncharacterized protein n=1 Tax=Ixodes persulcatus TaxID=34615 RepID=A0AC60PRH0_IXOPE|nr:hypothetical protein HPB47_000605 [Ixodes persulcatus]